VGSNFSAVFVLKLEGLHMLTGLKALDEFSDSMIKRN
jgi:hypothetical protein